MKKIKLLVLLAAISSNLYAQGWQSASPSTMYAVNSSLSLTPITVGIGVSAPTEQLHTTAGVRFAGITQLDQLNRIMVQDNTGKIFWRDASTIGSGASWSLFGNANTTPGTSIGQNYFGTTDNKRLVLATNATERMTIMNTSGFVGIGNTAPSDKLHLSGGNILLDNVLHGTSGNLFFGSNNVTDPHLRLYYENAGVSPNTGGVISVNTPDDNNGLIFRVDNSSGAAHRVLINGRGQVGINTDAPTSFLDVNCANVNSPSDVRFENLPLGHGNVLVIDRNGYVFQSDKAQFKDAPADDGNTRKIEALEKEVESLKALLYSYIKDGKPTSLNNVTDEGKIVFELAPNPAADQALVKYRIAATGDMHAVLRVTDITGKTMQETDLKEANGTVLVNTSAFASGTYICTLISNAGTVGSTKLVVAH